MHTESGTGERPLRRGQVGMLPPYGVGAINFVAQVDGPLLKQALASWNCAPMSLQGAKIIDKKTLLEGFASQGILSEPVRTWESLRAALGALVRSRPDQPQALIWLDADQMLHGGLPALVDAADVLVDLTRELYATDRVFVTFLLGNDANFPPFLGTATAGE